MINKDDINEIVEKTDIVELIKQYVDLNQKGKNYFGLCPFHDDHSPSMSVSPQKQIYTCFSCGATGNAVGFLMDYENIDFVTAIKILADKAGIKLEGYEQRKDFSSNNNELFDINEIAVKLFQNNLSSKDGIEASKYLADRNITKELVGEFKIGLSLGNLYKVLEKKNFDKKTLLETGLINLSNDYYDVFKDRIMFAIHDVNGKVIAYSGRIYKKDDNNPKYINTKENAIFKKGELLYNYHLAKEHARKKQTIIVMEGFMDVIRAYSLGINNVVATMGTAVTSNQANLLKKMAKNVLLCMDSDDAGQKAINDASNELIKIGVIPSVIVLDNAKDPDEFLQKFGREEFEKKVDYKIDIIDFKLNYYKKHYDINNSAELTNLINLIIKDVSLINDNIYKEIAYQKISKISGLDIKFLKNKEEYKPIIKTENEVKKNDRYEKAQQYFLYYMLNSKEIIKKYINLDIYFPNKKYRLVASSIVAYYDQYQDIDLSKFMSFINNDSEKVKILGEIISLNLKDNYKVEEIEDYIRVIEEYNRQTTINKYNEKLLFETDKQNQKDYLSEIIRLKKGE
jgi:DNA primase